MTDKLNIFVADDHPIFRSCLLYPSPHLLKPAAIDLA